MSETERSPAWLLPLIVVILIGSIVLLFIASRPVATDLPSEGGVEDFREGPFFRLPQLSSPTNPVDPCTLVDQNDLQEILGRELSDPQSVELENPIGERLCVFSSPDDLENRLLVVDMVFQQGMEAIMTQNEYDVIELYRGRKVQDRGIVELTGIEEDAFWGGAGAEIWSGLHVRSADIYMRVLVYDMDDESALEIAREVAVIVLDNLFE